jgi:hypothetical protein
MKKDYLRKVLLRMEVFDSMDIEYLINVDGESGASPRTEAKEPMMTEASGACNSAPIPVKNPKKPVVIPTPQTKPIT